MSAYQSQRLRVLPGQGEVQCPKKGLMAIVRCIERQLETADEGASCTCPTYESFQGDIPMRVPDDPAEARGARPLGKLTVRRRAARG